MADRAPPDPALTSLPYDGDESAQCHALLDALPFYVLLVDEDHQIVAANTAVSNDLGQTPQHLCGEFCPKAIHGSDDAYPGCPLEEAVEAGVAVEKELYDGEHKVWTQSAVYPTRLTDEQGRPLYVHFARDITSEKTADNELSQSLEHHKALGRLLERLQRCRRPHQVLSELIDLTMSLSWMSVAHAAAGFLYRKGQLKMVASRNLDSETRHRCASVNRGHCLCGLVAESGRAAVASSEEVAKVLEAQEWADHHHGHATLPLIYEQRTLGVLNFYLREDETLLDSQLEFLEASAGVAATALAEQLAREEARKVREEKLKLERRLLERVLSSQEDERKRVARELHDDLGQALSALLLEIRAEDGKSAASYGGFQKRMEGSIRELIEKVSMLAWELRPSILDDYGLRSAIHRYVERLVELSGLDIDFQYVSAGPDGERLSSDVEVVLYRITQESLNNVVRHAEATRVSVLLVQHADSVTLLVEDDGRGFDPERLTRADDEQRLGLIGMEERSALLHGTVRLESAPGKGTTVKVNIPLRVLDPAASEAVDREAQTRDGDDDTNPDR